MDAVTIAVVVIAVAIVALTVFAIPALIEAKKAATAATEIITTTNGDLKPLLKDLRFLIDNLQAMTADVSENTGDVKLFMESLGDTGRNLKLVNGVVGAVAGAISASSLWLTGARVAGKFVLDRVTKKGGNRHG